MKFRLRAFALHLLASAIALTLVLGTLYLGWYRWPGWYVSDVSAVIPVLIGVDLTLGPLFTFIVARGTKPRRELARDIAIIATVQLAALTYGTVSLWSGRPLYYAFSENVLQLVQSYDINAQERVMARAHNAGFVPHWYSLPRWIWAPLPADPKEAERIAISALNGGDDVISMPRYFKPWEQGLPALRKHLKKVSDVAYFSPPQKHTLEQRMRALGLDAAQPNAMPLTGRGDSLLVVFDPATLRIRAILAAPLSSPSLGHQPGLVRRYVHTLETRLAKLLPQAGHHRAS